MLASLVKRYSAGQAAVVGGAAAAASVPAVALCAKDDKDKIATPSFDPEALERGAKALREINASPYAKKVGDDRPRHLIVDGFRVLLDLCFL